jgi:hypothetical protein
MINHTISAGKRFPVTAVAIALALAVVLCILAMQGVALVTTHTTHPVVVQQGSSDLGSTSIGSGPCAIKSWRTPRWCFSGKAGREETRGASERPTLRQLTSHKS